MVAGISGNKEGVADATPSYAQFWMNDQNKPIS
jgi:hypothetical protein